MKLQCYFQQRLKTKEAEGQLHHQAFLFHNKSQNWLLVLKLKTKLSAKSFSLTYLKKPQIKRGSRDSSFKFTEVLLSLPGTDMQVSNSFCTCAYNIFCFKENLPWIEQNRSVRSKGRISTTGKKKTKNCLLLFLKKKKNTISITELVKFHQLSTRDCDVHKINAI